VDGQTGLSSSTVTLFQFMDACVLLPYIGTQLQCCGKLISLLMYLCHVYVGFLIFCLSLANSKIYGFFFSWIAAFGWDMVPFGVNLHKFYPINDCVPKLSD
jgi:hypothetical protein